MYRKKFIYIEFSSQNSSKKYEVADWKKRETIIKILWDNKKASTFLFILFFSGDLRKKLQETKYIYKKENAA